MVFSMFGGSKGGPQLRPMQQSDMGGVLRIISQHDEDDFEEARDDLRENFEGMFVLADGSKVVGITGGNVDPHTDDVVWLSWTYVDVGRQGEGLGTGLEYQMGLRGDHDYGRQGQQARDTLVSTDHLSDHKHHKKDGRADDRRTQVRDHGIDNADRRSEQQSATVANEQQVTDHQQKGTQNSHMQPGDGQQMHGAAGDEGLLRFGWQLMTVAQQQCQSHALHSIRQRRHQHGTRLLSQLADPVSR